MAIVENWKPTVILGVEKVRGTSTSPIFVETDMGKGVVEDVQLLKGLVKVRFEDNFDYPSKIFRHDEIKIIKNKKGRAKKIFEEPDDPADGKIVED